MSPREIGTRLGRAIAHGMLADGRKREWPGLDPLDADYGRPLAAAGIKPGTEAWREAESAGAEAYRRTMAKGF
jgi:hypothetical protein